MFLQLIMMFLQDYVVVLANYVVATLYSRDRAFLARSAFRATGRSLRFYPPPGPSPQAETAGKKDTQWNRARRNDQIGRAPRLPKGGQEQFSCHIEVSGTFKREFDST
jgi:hypothetical protein